MIALDFYNVRRGLIAQYRAAKTPELKTRIDTLIRLLQNNDGRRHFKQAIAIYMAMLGSDRPLTDAEVVAVARAA
jgi:hypothetical protein